MCLHTFVSNCLMNHRKSIWEAQRALAISNYLHIPQNIIHFRLSHYHFWVRELRILDLHALKALFPTRVSSVNQLEDPEKAIFQLDLAFCSSRYSLAQKCFMLIHFVLPEDEGPFSPSLMVHLLSCSISTTSCFRPSSFSSSINHNTSSKVVLNAISSAAVELLATDFCWCSLPTLAH